jgi:hypothetical protein
VILWVGEADWWNGGQPMPRLGEPRFAFPLCEEAADEVAESGDFGGLRRISSKARRAASDRHLLRTTLDRFNGDLNPVWQYSPFGGVMKRRHSTLGNGVLVDREAVIWEDYVPPPQYEQNGVVVGGQVRLFRTLRQAWTEERAVPRIRLYQIVEPPPGMVTACLRALRALEVDDSPFCVELRHHPVPGPRGELQWKVVEVNTRLGEDPCHPFLLWPTHPLRQVERWVEELT